MPEHNEFRNSKQGMKLIVSLLTYNSALYLPECLKSIERQTFQDFELVCRDNNSSDDTPQVLQRMVTGGRAVLTPTNDGFSRGHNATIRETSSEYVCILNPDLVLAAHYFAECVAFLDAHPRTAAVSGLLMRVRALTERPESAIIDSSGIVLSRTGRAYNKGAGKGFSASARTVPVLGVPATAVVYRRAALEDVALDIDGRREFFDEDFFMYKEDVDLALRLVLRGWQAATINAVRAYHIRSTDPKLFVRPSPFANSLSYRNHWFVLIKDMPRSFLLRNGLLIFTYELAKVLYLLAREPRTLTALCDVVKLSKKMFVKRALIMKRKTAPLALTPNAS